jgi:hypothetical protein
MSVISNPQRLFHSNGIDGSTGEYALPPYRQ